VHACIDAWFASGNMNFYRVAVKMADAMIARFYDDGGAFYDAAAQPSPERFRWARWARGASRCRIRPRRPAIPPPPRRCLRLEALSGRQEYRDIAEDTLGCFAGIVEHFRVVRGQLRAGAGTAAAGSGAGGGGGLGSRRLEAAGRRRRWRALR
jgi:uncharacterized protein YyaL (SSP411 family)